MTYNAIAETSHEVRDESYIARQPTHISFLLTGIYRDIGLAAIASELRMALNELEPDVGQAVARGISYLYLYVYLKPNSDRAVQHIH